MGNNPASLSYIKGKEKACEAIGFESQIINLNENISEVELINEVNKLNLDKSVDGLLVQMPLPKHINKYNVIEAIDPSKDVDGLHPINVGKPVATLLEMEDCTVTICHSKTKDIENVTKLADIVIVSIGIAKYVNSNWIKKGAYVVDVGINRVDGKLVGDVDFDCVVDKCNAITPVLKGVGPMTIAMLLSNTYKAYLLHEKGIEND